MSQRERKYMGKILVVDDEKNILSALKREFMLTDVKVFIAQKISEAMEIMEEEKIDVVISDFRMPEMDGMNFLNEIKEKFPQTARLVFSGFIDRKILMRSLTNGRASTFFTKPWNKEALQNKIKRIIKIKHETQEDGVFLVLNNIFELPTFPTRRKKFLNSITENEPTETLREIIEMDSVIAAKVLQIANSAFFGEKEISTIEEAIKLLNKSSFEDIAVSTRYFQELNWTEEEIDNMRDIHIMSTMRYKYMPLFHKILFGRINKYSYFSISLKFDIGKLILLHHFPREYYGIKDYQLEHPEKNFIECENLIGLSSKKDYKLGAYLLDLWNIPESLLYPARIQGFQEEEYKKNFKVYCYLDKLFKFIIKKETPHWMDLAPFILPGITEQEFKKITKEITREIKELKEELSQNPYLQEKKTENDE